LLKDSKIVQELFYKGVDYDKIKFDL